jgi:hypothetical protein
MSAAKDLTQALGGRWRGRYGMARCVSHPDRNASLAINDGRDGMVLIKCFAGCAQLDVIAALQSLGLWRGRGDSTRTEAERQAQRQRDADRERDEGQRAAFIEKTWRQTWNAAVPACGSPIEAWLLSRSIDAKKLDLNRLPLRWTPSCPMGREAAPAMVALMTDPLTAEPCGLHRTYLTADGSAKAFGKDSRKMLGRGGTIRLSEDAEVELGLGICEGIETGLAIMAAGWRPIWACGSLGALTAFPVLGGIETLIIFSDDKPHEVEGARSCAARRAAAGREALARIPSHGDWNDALVVT